MHTVCAQGAHTAPGQVSDHCQIVLGTNLANLGPYPFGRTLEKKRPVRDKTRASITLGTRLGSFQINLLLIPQFCPHRPGTVWFLLEMEAPDWPRGLRRAPFRPDLYIVFPYGLQLHNRSSQF